MDWPDGAAVTVRMGLHTGEGTLGGANYLGLDVNRTARIAAAGHGGQVLLSGATRALVVDSLPDGTALLDLGQHRLRDLLEPERLYQLAMDGLEREFPPLRTLDAQPNNLPAQLTRFIGRSAEIARVRELLDGNRLVTLTGPGGSGKTRLGLQVAAEALPQFRDGVFFVDLSALTDAADVSQEIAGVLHVRLAPGRPVVEELTEHLRDRQLLLVLDNFEQVMDAGAAAVEPILRAAGAVKLVVTSRVPLHLYGEQEFPVPPMVVPLPDRSRDPSALLEAEAVVLFVERAAAARPDFQITPENASAVAEIAARLDGLPLAIELAASRIRVLSVEQLLSRLEQRLPLLQTKDASRPERQRTLRRTIEWSHELLDPAERRLFARLSVFVGGADLGAVEAVANEGGGLGADTLDAIASLVDKSLVRSITAANGEPRFVMLETIREFATEQLVASGEGETIRRRHAEHWIDVAESLSPTLFGAEQDASIQRLERDHDNFRAALGWILAAEEAEMGMRLGAALRDFWRVGSHVREGVSWLLQILALPSAAPRTRLRAAALIAAVDAASWMGGLAGESQVRFANEALQIYRELDDATGIADALAELAVAKMSVGQLVEGRADLEEARRLQAELGNRQRVGECTLAMGLSAMMAWEPAEARGDMEEALVTFTDLRDPYWIAFAQRLIGGVDQIQGDLEAAEQRYRTSLIGAHDHGILTMVASGLVGMAHLAAVREQAERTLRLQGATDALEAKVGERPPMEAEMVGDIRGPATVAVGPARAEALYNEGVAMSVDEAVTYALDDRLPGASGA